MVPEAANPGLPSWVARAPFAVWVCDTTGRLVFVNERARSVLGNGRGLVGRSCDESVGGTGESGQPLCGSSCAMRQSVLEHEHPAPVLMRIHGEGRWALVVPLVLEGGQDREDWIAHCAYDLDPLVRAASYLKCIAARSGECIPSRSRALRTLTPRERQILGLLGRDEETFSIARALHVSTTTVRNHVQHILAKLGVHSIQEAVAVSLLDDRGALDSNGPEASRPCGEGEERPG